MSIRRRSWYNPSEFDLKKTEAYFDGWKKQDDYPSVVRSHLVLEKLKSFELASVLEIGFGAGSMLLALLRRGYDAYGIDLSPELVRYARERLKDENVSPERAHVGRSSDLSRFDAQSFDCVIMDSVLRYLSDQEETATFDECRRVLRDNGLVIFTCQNVLFDLFTLNAFTLQFLRHHYLDWEPVRKSCDPDRVFSKLEAMLATGQVERFRSEKDGEVSAASDEVFVKAHNPLTIRQITEARGFTPIDLSFYFMHPFPPVLRKEFEEEFTQARASMEFEHAHDWRGHFCAYEFLMVCRKR